jgi:hypothetical protein
MGYFRNSGICAKIHSPEILFCPFLIKQKLISKTITFLSFWIVFQKCKIILWFLFSWLDHGWILPLNNEKRQNSSICIPYNKTSTNSTTADNHCISLFSFFLCSLFFFFFFIQGPLCSPSWPQTYNPPPSGS